MEGAGLMKIKQIRVVMLVLFATVGIEMRSVRAQVAAQPAKPSAVIPLETIGDPAARAPAPAPIWPPNAGTPGQTQSIQPSPQGPSTKGSGINSAVGQLRNPFNGGKGQQPLHSHGDALNELPSLIYPSPQRANGSGMGGRAAVGELRNPFDGAQGQPLIHRHDGPASGSPQTAYPSPQSMGGGATVGKLRNPYGGWTAQPQKGLLDYASPQTSTAPGAGAAPGAALAPGAGAGATAPGAAAGAGTTPGGAPTPGAEAPGTPPAAGAGTTPGAAAGDGFGAAATTAGPGFGGALEAAVTPFAMIGDLGPISIEALATKARNPGPPVPPSNRGASPIYAAARNLKISENQSPRPQDRVYFSFNYYNNVDNTVNRRDLSPVTQMKVYQYLFGLEKTFNDGKGSIGFRVPLDTLTANSSPPGALSTPTSTSAGNFSIIAKYILEQNLKTGSLVSVGMAITTPTGPSKFAGAPYLFGLNSVYFQPYIGYIYNYKRMYIQGFSGFNFTSNINDVSYVFNDIGIGYYAYRDDDPRAFLSAVAPTFELHVNNPINHRDVFSRTDLAGMPDTVDLTFGLNLQFRHNAVLTFAYVNPVGSPRPFDSEAIMMLNLFYGRTRAGLIPITPPPTL
jgi:hypothetical protein